LAIISEGESLQKPDSLNNKKTSSREAVLPAENEFDKNFENNIRPKTLDEYIGQSQLKETLKIGKTCIWSRSRKEYWVKGMTSGHFQYVKSVAYDCDCDTLLIKVRQVGSACHTFRKSCFYRKIKENQ